MIELINNLSIKVDNYNYILRLDTNKVDENGEKIYKNLTYHDSISKAIKEAKRYSIKIKLMEDIYKLDEAVEIINKINKEFENLLNEVLDNE